MIKKIFKVENIQTEREGGQTVTIHLIHSQLWRIATKKVNRI